MTCPYHTQSDYSADCTIYTDGLYFDARTHIHGCMGKISNITLMSNMHAHSLFAHILSVILNHIKHVYMMRKKRSTWKYVILNHIKHVYMMKKKQSTWKYVILNHIKHVYMMKKTINLEISEYFTIIFYNGNTYTILMCNLTVYSLIVQTWSNNIYHPVCKVTAPIHASNFSNNILSKLRLP